jgi:bifunctional non-homologous end joining protein LigD
MAIPEALEQLSESARDHLEEKHQPEWISPMLAQLTRDYFSDPDWIYERKLDGERCLVYRDGGRIRLLSRNQQNLNNPYPELVEALKNQEPDSFIADGEIVAFEGAITSFSRLQQRMHIQDPQEARESGVAVYYYLFDLLYLQGFDLTQVKLRDRKQVLKAAFTYTDPLRYMNHRNEQGESYLEDACRKGWEGIIAKDARSSYLSSRSKKWLKFKCGKQQEFIIGGYTEPEGERIGFGALLLGYYDKGQLKYSGKVGTGFNDQALRALKKRLSSLEQEDPPFNEPNLPGREVHWVQPRLIAQVEFEEWTRTGKLRHPCYQGLRRDKDPKEVVREAPE